MVGDPPFSFRSGCPHDFLVARRFSHWCFSFACSRRIASLGIVSTLRNAMSRRSAGVPPSGDLRAVGPSRRFHHTAIFLAMRKDANARSRSWIIY
jgi:hypothetical protein